MTYTRSKQGESSFLTFASAQLVASSNTSGRQAPYCCMTQHKFCIGSTDLTDMLQFVHECTVNFFSRSLFAVNFEVKANYRTL
jgi:hypothetical protein